MDVPVFSIAANSSCLFMTKALQEATVRFRRAIARKQGLCCILGDNGLGKSSLLKFLARAAKQGGIAMPLGGAPDTALVLRECSKEPGSSPGRSRRYNGGGEGIYSKPGRGR